MRLGDEMRGERATIGKSLLDVQRELRIKASYIAAIENADLSAFDSLSFVAGYVRSYARYLDMDPEVAFARFCEESGFGGIGSLKPMESEVSRRMSLGADLAAVPNRVSLRPKTKPAQPIDPLLGAGNPFAKKATPVFAGFEPGALGSLVVLALLVGGIGYGGWTVVQEIQRVQVAPVEEAPILQAELDPVMSAIPEVPDFAPEAGGVEVPSQDPLARLYRPQALETPILTARDAPISTIRPGPPEGAAAAPPMRLAAADPGEAAPSDFDLSSAIDGALVEALGGLGAPEPETPATPEVLAQGPGTVTLVAVRDAWVRVRSAEGDTLFERVLAPGDTYEIPATEVPATLRTGNSGALYFAVGGQTYGPLAPGVQVVNAELSASLVTERYAIADLDGDRDLARVVAQLSAGPSGSPPPTE
jgi:cytoskeletal protein RodZ